MNIIIKVDNSTAIKAHAAANKVFNVGKRLSLSANLSTYKMKAVTTPLTEEDLREVVGIVRELVANDWLSAADTDWCFKQGIVFTA